MYAVSQVHDFKKKAKISNFYYTMSRKHFHIVFDITQAIFKQCQRDAEK